MGGLSRWLVRTKFGLLCLVGIEVFGCEASVTSCSAMVGSRACFAELWLSGAMTARVRCTDVCLEVRLCLHRAPPHSVSSCTDLDSLPILLMHVFADRTGLRIRVVLATFPFAEASASM